MTARCPGRRDDARASFRSALADVYPWGYAVADEGNEAFDRRLTGLIPERGVPS